VDGLRKLTDQDRRRNIIKGLNVSLGEFLTYFLFVDEDIIFGAYFFQYIKDWKGIMESFCIVTVMQINNGKSVVLTNAMGDDMQTHLMEILPFECKCIVKGMKYLRFELKPNSYSYDD